MLNYQNPASPAGVARQRGNRNTRIENPPNTQSRVAANDQPSWQPTKASHAFGTPPRRGGKGGGGPKTHPQSSGHEEDIPTKKHALPYHAHARALGGLVGCGVAEGAAMAARRGGGGGVPSTPPELRGGGDLAAPPADLASRSWRRRHPPLAARSCAPHRATPLPPNACPPFRWWGCGGNGKGAPPWWPGRPMGWGGGGGGN